MKKILKMGLALILVFSMLIGGVMAAETTPITVQLDGTPLTFTDAVPQVREQRTFLPFRAVFEAMGAEVSNSGNIITARRGDKILTMTIGSTEASVTSAGKTRSIQMDVAPYVDSATWRTYVPVRFAAQAFDCAVGWDQSRSTAIIVDTERLVERAMAGKTFAYMDKLGALGDQYSQGIWDMTSSLNTSVSILSVPMTISGTITGTIQDADKVSVDMHMKADMDQFVSLLTAMGGAEPDAEAQAALAALKTDGIRAALRGTMSQDTLYLNMDMGALNGESGVDPNTWYTVSAAELLDGSGSDMDLAGLLTKGNSVNLKDMVYLLISATELSDATTAYTDLKETVTALFTALSDENFTTEGHKRTATFTLPMGELDMTATLALDLDGDTVTGYAMNLASELAGEQDTSLNADLRMDAAGQVSVKATMDIGTFICVDLDMSGQYTPGQTAPITQPPAGSNIIPITSDMLQA